MDYQYLVKLLIQAFPESGTTQDKHGMVPLNYACMKTVSDISMDITVLADEFPKSCTIANHNGKMLFQLLKEHALQKDEDVFFCTLGLHSPEISLYKCYTSN